MYYKRFGAHPNHMHIQIIVKNNLLGKKERGKKKKQERKTQQHRLGTNVRVRGFNTGLLARSQFASGRSCARPTRSKFSVIFLCPKANAELVPKSHFALHASHTALPMVTLKILPCTNVTLTLGWITLFLGDIGEEALNREDEVTAKQRN
jgi:hypothetical protein